MKLEKLSEREYLTRIEPGDSLEGMDTLVPEEGIQDGYIIYRPCLVSLNCAKRKIAELSYRYPMITEYNEYEAEVDSRRIIRDIKQFLSLVGNSEDAKKEAGKVVADLLNTLYENEGNSETFPYEFAEEISKEFDAANPFD